MSLQECQRQHTNREYNLWMAYLEQKQLIKIVKPPKPGVDGPPIVTKEMIIKFNQQRRLLGFQKAPTKKLK